jgi:competence protein ComEC
VISFGGFVSSLISAITPIANFVCQIFDFILNPFLKTLVNISDFWGHLPNSSIQTTHPSVIQIIIYYLLLLCITGLFYKDFREKYLKPTLIAFAILLSIWLISLIPIKNSNLEIITFDVGNADCFLIKTPKNEYIMIDTGKIGYNGGKSQAEIIVLKYLKDNGIKNIDSLIITHFDNDHCGGAKDVLEKTKVNKIYLNDLNHSSIAAKSIYNAAQSSNTKIIQAQNKQIIYDNKDLKLTNLLDISTDDDNENSIITLLEYKNYSILFTGDAGIKGIESVLNLIPKNITVLKVPHHGAIDGLNKAILEHLNPKYSIISVGENYFGHPAEYTLKLLKNSNILRTDINNAIFIKVNKKQFKILNYDLYKKKFIN